MRISFISSKAKEMRYVTIQLKDTSPENISKQNEMLDMHGIAHQFTKHEDYSEEQLGMTSEELEEIFVKPLGSLFFNPEKSRVALFFTPNEVEMYGFRNGLRVPCKVHRADQSPESLLEENNRLKSAIRDIIQAEIDHKRHGDPYEKLVGCIVAANKIAFG